VLYLLIRSWGSRPRLYAVARYRGLSNLKLIVRYRGLSNLKLIVRYRGLSNLKLIVRIEARSLHRAEELNIKTKRREREINAALPLCLLAGGVRNHLERLFETPEQVSPFSCLLERGFRCDIPSSIFRW